MAAPEECYESENKWKCTEPEKERMNDDIVELNDTELIYFVDETDSDDASNDSDEDSEL